MLLAHTPHSFCNHRALCIASTTLCVSMSLFGADSAAPADTGGHSAVDDVDVATVDDADAVALTDASASVAASISKTEETELWLFVA